MERHHHHATVDEVIVFHDDEGEPDYLFKGWTQTEACDCGMPNPFRQEEAVPQDLTKEEIDARRRAREEVRRKKTNKGPSRDRQGHPSRNRKDRA